MEMLSRISYRKGRIKDVLDIIGSKFSNFLNEVSISTKTLDYLYNVKPQ